MDETVALSLSEESVEEWNLEAEKIWDNMRKSGLLCDVTIETEDGGSFKAHKIVLSSCSRYFQVLFTTRLNSETKHVHLVPGISADVMSEIIEFAYKGNINLTKDNVTDILIGADQFHVMELLKKCCDFLLCRLDIENCIGFKVFATTYSCFDLEKAAYKFLMHHFEEVTEQSQEFLEMTLEQVVTLLSSDHIDVRNEEVVWEAGIRWIDYYPILRQNYIDSIMRCVRLGLLDTHYFKNNIQRDKYVQNNNACKSIIIETLRFLWDLDMIDEMTHELETPRVAMPRIPYSVLFTIGGLSGDAVSSVIETYDTKADRWIQVPEVDPTGARAYHKLAVIGFDIYVIGGFDGHECFNSVRCFNAITKTWKNVAPMNFKRCYVSVVNLNGLIYAMGGYDGHHSHNTVERYDSHTNQWTFLTPMNLKRCDASAAVLNDFIYIVGGNNESECTASCEVYNPEIDVWTTVASMNNRRSGVSAVSYHGMLYALGGFNGVSRLWNGERYDPVTDTWSEVPDMFHARSNFAVEVMDDMIFVMGGFNGLGTSCHVECYDDRTKEWYDATDMHSFRSGLAACVIPGLPNVSDYAHPNRKRLLEEKRQKALQLKSRNRSNCYIWTAFQNQNGNIDEERGENEYD